MMQLLVFRHGIATEHASPHGDDGRPLTDEGIRRTRRAARGLRRIVDTPDIILTSPKLRAVQTAEIVGKVFDRKPQVLRLLAEDNARAILQTIFQLNKESVLIVGHEPTLSRVVEIACAGEGADHFIEMKKAACACIDLFPGPSATLPQGNMRFLAPPDLLRAIGSRRQSGE